MPVYKIPGVYIEETNAFPNSIVQVETGVPAFIGTTANALDPRNGRSLIGTCTRIASLAEYDATFGAGAGLAGAMALFYANGGGPAYVACVGASGAPLTLDALRAALALLEREAEPAFILAPESVDLTRDDHYAFAREMIAHCARMQSRMAIVDVHGGGGPTAANVQAGEALIAEFRARMAAVPEAERCFGACYFPYLRTSAGATVPPSAAVAGIWASVDAQRGVWKAPANVALAAGLEPAYPINTHEQEGMNAPADGFAINAIRAFPGKGVLIWGARTLDGNSADWRYVSVRRTMIMIEQSAKLGVRSYVFEPNDANTWVTVKSMLGNFLFNLWKQGALAGAKPEEAFSIQCGLGSTMTGEDILEGRLRVTILAALLKPAEFMIITFQQQMQAA
jgi:phage tail sheath protein FI